MDALIDYVTCTSCGITARKPPWQVSRDLGFLPGVHCTMLANRLGKLHVCKEPSCETCPINAHYCVRDAKGNWRWRGDRARGDDPTISGDQPEDGVDRDSGKEATR
jgi:hypothetical protein